jgi:hypothetical protein
MIFDVTLGIVPAVVAARFVGRGDLAKRVTPAMQANLTDGVWSIGDLLLSSGV